VTMWNEFDWLKNVSNEWYGFLFLLSSIPSSLSIVFLYSIVFVFPPILLGVICIILRITVCPSVLYSHWYVQPY